MNVAEIRTMDTHPHMSLEQIHQVILDQLMILDHSDDVPGIPLLQGLFELAYESSRTSGDARERERKTITSCRLCIAAG
jgi:hypothetical protein